MQARQVTKDSGNCPLCKCGQEAAVELVSGYGEYIMVDAYLCVQCTNNVATDMLKAAADAILEKLPA